MVSISPITFKALVAQPPDLPEFQRGKVWSDQTKLELVLSTFLKYPIGALAICKSDGKEWLLDGQQRLDCITSMYSPYQVWSWFQTSMNISNTYKYFIEASDAKKETHINQSLRYLAYKWIGAIGEEVDDELEAKLAKMPNKNKNDKLAKAKKRSELRKKVLESVEPKEDHNYFEPWTDSKGVPKQPNAPTFLTLSKLFMAVGGIHKHNEVCQTTLERNLFGNYSAAQKESEYFKEQLFCNQGLFNTEQCSGHLKDVSIMANHNKTNETKFVKEFVNKFDIYFTTSGRKKWEDEFQVGSSELSELISSLTMLHEYYHFLDNCEVGKIMFEDLHDRRTTFLDQMKVFQLINAAGTELNEIELIVVNPGWRKQLDLSDTSKFGELQKILNQSQEKLLLKGPQTPDSFEFNQIQKWQIACSFDYGFRKLYPNSGLERIL